MIIDTTPDRPRVLGEVDLFSAQVLVHERAIYLHESTQYYVDRLEWHERKAYVHKVDVDHYTYANRAVTLKPLDVFAESPAPGGRRAHGEVMVASLVTLFKKLKFGTDENVGWGPIDLPELELQTTAYWFTAEGAAQGWRRDDLDVALIGAGALHQGRFPRKIECFQMLGRMLQRFAACLTALVALIVVDRHDRLESLSSRHASHEVR